ncbi:MAG: ribonuclease E inhibitor RraB [Longicatena sp.]
MKKIIPVLAILGGAAALAAYKIKKDEQKKIIDLDEGMLYDEALAENEDDPVEEGPISDPTSCCVEDVKDKIKDTLDSADEAIDEASDKVETFAENASKKVKKAVKDAKEVFPNLLEEEINELKDKAKAIMEDMRAQGDVHENERPVQHTVHFDAVEDAENFKNKIINKGYVVSAGETELELLVLHIAPLDEVKLIANILYIVNEVRANHGTYDGWTSKITY